MRDEVRLLVFARAPVPGRAKTRLIPALGEAGAARLAARLAEQTLSRVRDWNLCPVELWCDPDRHHPFFALCRRRFGVALHDQQGPDLGARMHHALADALGRAQAAVLIGTDCTALQRADIQQAIAALADGRDAVLGPAEDGGYYLIGLRRPEPRLFERIGWGGDTVLAQTRHRLRALGLSWAELAARPDLDRPEDLSAAGLAGG